MAPVSINNDRAGLFGPNSVLWRVNQEAAVLLGGPCAILMQLAHPKVAAGVRDHSQFERDTLGRLHRTLELSLAWVFGSRDEAMQAVRVVNRRHDAVRGPDYSAKDPDLLMWVLATLVYAPIRAYRAFVGPLSDDEADQYYQDIKAIGTLLGIPESMYPARLREYQAYIDAMIEQRQVAVSVDALRLGSTVLQLGIPGVPRLAFAPIRIITKGLLPPRLREQYGLEWGRRDRTVFATCQRILPRVLRMTPSAIRYQIRARRAYRRLRVQPA